MGRPTFSPGKKLTGGKFRPVTPVRPDSSQPDTSVPTGPLVTLTTDFESFFF